MLRRKSTTAEEEHNHCPAEGISALTRRYSNSAGDVAGEESTTGANKIFHNTLLWGYITDPAIDCAEKR